MQKQWKDIANNTMHIGMWYLMAICMVVCWGKILTNEMVFKDYWSTSSIQLLNLKSISYVYTKSRLPMLYKIVSLTFICSATSPTATDQAHEEMNIL